MIYVIGIGAAGNKAAIKALECEIIDPDYVTIINSTGKDIPTNFKENAIIIGDKLKGCGKERSISQEAIIKFLKGTDIFENIPTDVDRIVIVTSTEGGTGSGSAPILDKYIREVIGLNASIFAFTGFETDVRGMKNTINFMQDLDDQTTIQIVSNKKFLQKVNNNYSKAEAEANVEFCRRLIIMSGSILEESSQNIDDTDLHKLIDAPGLLDIVYTDLDDQLKNMDAFNKVCSQLADESKSIDFEPTAARLGFIFNGKDTTRDVIDYSYSVLKSKYGEPFEVYTHIQENTSFKKEFVACIASGMKLPTEAIQKTYDEYLERTAKVSKDKDSFFDTLNSFTEDEKDSIFDLKEKSAGTEKDDFFSKYK